MKIYILKFQTSTVLNSSRAQLGTSLSYFRNLIRSQPILSPRFPIFSVKPSQETLINLIEHPFRLNPFHERSRKKKKTILAKRQTWSNDRVLPSDNSTSLFNELSMQIKDTRARRRFIDCSFHSRWNAIPAEGARPGIVDYRDSGRPVLLCDRPFVQGISLITCIPRLTQLSRPLEAILLASGNLLRQVIQSEEEGKVSPTLWGIIHHPVRINVSSMLNTANGRISWIFKWLWREVRAVYGRIW